MRAWGSRGAALLFAFALAALMLESASLPHVHDQPGWHNQEHDLLYLATLAAAGVPAAVATAPVPLAVERGSGPSVRPRARAVAWRHRAPRAPPAR